MSTYEFVLFIHFCALIGAVAVSALVHFSQLRMVAARTVADLRTWAGLTEKLAKIFPIVILALLVSGMYMVQAQWHWNAGWIDASLAGIFLLTISGPLIIARRHHRLMHLLASTGDGPINAELARWVHDPLMHSAAWANTMLALGIVLVMVVKLSLTPSVVILAFALIVGVTIAIPLRRSRHTEADVTIFD